MRPWWLLTVLFVAGCLARPEAVGALQAGQAMDLQRKQDRSGGGKQRRPGSVQLTEKRPAWAEALLEEAESEDLRAKAPVRRVVSENSRAIPPLKEAVSENLHASGSAEIAGQHICYGVQVGAFRLQTNAHKLADQMSKKYRTERILLKARDGEDPIVVVVVGCKDELEGARSLRDKLSATGTDGIAIKVD